MYNINKLIISAAMAALPMSIVAQGDSVNTPAQLMQSGGYDYLMNIEKGSINPTSISHTAIQSKGELGLGYRQANGSFHAVDRSGRTHGFNFEATGIKRLRNIVFEGGVRYYNETEKSARWNTSLYQNRLNPFILADSVKSDYDLERFHVDGRFSYSFTENFRFGVNADYHVGVRSDEQDPRAETRGMRFILNPGIEWDVTGHLSIGATGGINLFNESTRYSTVATAQNYRFFLMTGLGTFYPQSGTAYSRDSKGTSWFGSVSARFKFSNSVSDFLEVKFGHDSENATDGGSSYQFRAGDYMNDFLRIFNRVSILGETTAHNIEARFETNDVKGKWYDQESETVNGTISYVVRLASIRHKQKLTVGSVKYRFDLLGAGGVPSLTAAVSGNFYRSESTNFPETYFASYSRAGINAEVVKHFMISKVYLGVGVDGGYSKCFNTGFNFAGQDLEKAYTTPMYAWNTAGYGKVAAKVDVKVPVGAFFLGAYVSGGSVLAASSYNDCFKGATFNNFNCGVSLSF